LLIFSSPNGSSPREELDSQTFNLKRNIKFKETSEGIEEEEEEEEEEEINISVSQRKISFR